MNVTVRDLAVPSVISLPLSVKTKFTAHELVLAGVEIFIFIFLLS